MSPLQQKDSLIKNAMTHADSLAGSFLKAFYRQVPADDLIGWKAENLALVANAVCDFSLERKSGQDKVRVFNPDKKKDGWAATQTSIVIVNDDMPFIVDSIAAELAGQGLAVDVLFHPVIDVLRDGNGKLKEVSEGGKPKEGFAAESVIYVQLEQMLSSEACKKLAAALAQVLRDVYSATSDWRKMLKKADEIIAQGSAAKGQDKDAGREGMDFLSWLRGNNFTFLGYRAYKFSKRGASAVAGSDLGVLTDGRDVHFGHEDVLPDAQALDQARWPVVVSKLVSQYATVHRRTPMDAVSVKVFDKDGGLAGVHVFVGLFTSSTYSCRTSEIPVIRRKVAETIVRAGFVKNSHDARALEHVLEKIPRDEMFQLSCDELHALSMGILGLQTKPRVALFSHLDAFRKYMSCLLYVPRDRYTTKFRERAARVIEKLSGGLVLNHVTTLDDSPMARILYVVRPGDKEFNPSAAEAELTDLGREWDERLKQVLITAFGKIKGAELAFLYGRAFTSAYHESMDIANAVHDIRHIEALRAGDEPIRVDFYRLQDMPPGDMRMKVYYKGAPVPLSDILPVLDNMGMRTFSEMPYEVRPHGHDSAVWIHDFAVRGAPDIDLAKVKDSVEETFLQVWRGVVENDGLNQLVFRASLTWREVRILRAYGGFMRQARLPYSRVYIEQVLNEHPQIASALVDLFKARHDPGQQKKADKAGERVLELLQDVQKRDHDRIMRVYKTLIENTLRTNYFQTDKGGAPRPCLAFKLDSKNITELPLPRPHVEIYVYSARVEGVHLRGGEIARGGIRWSDRHDDFRTEILSLMKSQQVKNTVIVPVGAKGGFIVKHPPKTEPGEAGKNISYREALQQEGVECYKLMVRALLDLTDNSVKGKIVRPKDIVCHDGPDPYLVVAADKGTATFSDIANQLSLEAGFWLGDAFASGGSLGYDHKKLGITARGGWESVKRHFRELGKDIQKEPFTMIGVGDMAGDVFGNGLLLSRQAQLVAAFNHMHIFCDPEPDMERSYAERQRLFKSRGGWDAYDKSVLSPGGGVFERSAKAIRLTPQIKKRFGFTQDSVSPDDLVQAILKAEVELIWFGGIGTFVKGSRQSHADADDKSNDALRVDARDIRARVIGEGANLGVTQLGRVEYARQGGHINTDFIDNSGGVDCSDHEVNIKILLGGVVQGGKMTPAQRDKLLEEMTDDVCELVLRDNYQQSQSLSLQLLRAGSDIGLHQNLIREMEKANLIRRSLEGLPDDEAFARLEKEGQGLTRPELSVLMSWSKIVLYNQILASSLPDDPALEALLFDYFPKALHKYDAEIRKHQLRREIIATQVVNTVVNRMGPVFISSRMAKTGRSAEDIVRAFIVAMQAYGLPALWKKIEALDNKAPSAVQLSALHETYLVGKRATTWFLRFGGDSFDVGKEGAFFADGVEALRKAVRQMVPEDVLHTIQQTEARFAKSGMPDALAGDIAVTKLLSAACDIVNVARRTKEDIKEVAAAYFLVGERLGLDWLRVQLSSLVPANSWQARATGGLMDDYYAHQAALTLAIFRSGKPDKNRAQKWLEQHAVAVEKVAQTIADLKVQPKIELEMMVLAGQRIGQLVHVVD